MSELDDLLAHLDREAKNPGADYLPPAEVAKVLRVHTAALRRELAAAQEARLAAELRAEGLRGTLRLISEDDRSGWSDPAGQTDAVALEAAKAIAEAALDAPLPDLGPLRELVRVALDPTPFDADDLDERRRDIERGLAIRSLGAECAARKVIAAYPALDPGAEPAGEVTRG